MKKSLVLALVAVALIAAVGAGAWWLLAGPSEATERGRCADATYELGLEREDGVLEVTLELQSAASGETWGVALDQGATVLVETERTTDEDAEIDVDTFAEGADSAVEATLTPAQGDPCVVRASL